MAVDGYMYFQKYDGTYLKSESQVSLDKNDEQLCVKFKFKDVAKAEGLFEVEDFSFDIEQTLNIGSQSTGAGAGRVTFNPYSITRKIDRSSPELFSAACSGTPACSFCGPSSPDGVVASAPPSSSERRESDDVVAEPSTAAGSPSMPGVSGWTTASALLPAAGCSRPNIRPKNPRFREVGSLTTPPLPADDCPAGL